MTRRSFVAMVAGALVFLLCSVSSAVVPDKINYQGKLATSGGGCLNDTVSMTFTIYSDDEGTVVEWTEDQDSVIVKEGIFNVLLGSETPIPASVFDGSIKYLGVQVESDPEMRPLKPMVSVAYAYKSGEADTADFAWTAENADLLDGQHASSFLSTANDYGRSGVATDLYEGTSTLTDKYVNETGPEGVDATSGTAFTGHASGSSPSSMIGIKGYGNNSSSGSVYGGYFESTTSGTGIHSGIYALGRSSSSASAYGVQASASNSSDGSAYGGHFTVDAAGTGTHYGVRANSYSSSDGWHYGVYGSATNSSTGHPKGGYFYSSSTGTGSAVGMWGEGYCSSSNWAYGIVGEAINSSSGRAVGASFYNPPPYVGTGGKTGVEISMPDSSSATTYGIDVNARNKLGSVYGAYLSASSGPAGLGTGTKYGIYAAASGGETNYGVFASASTATGYAGYFSGDVRITDSLVVLGGKSAAVKVDNGEYRLLYSQESPEVWFEDFGKGRLLNGKAVIQIDPLFAQTVNTSVEYHVFLTPQDEPLTLAVANKTTDSFEVISPSGASIPFSYRIVAKRKGYENIRLAKMGKPTPEEVALEQEEHQAEREEEWARMEEQRQEMKKERERMEAENMRMEQEREKR
jgi:hypothetical protein